MISSHPVPARCQWLVRLVSVLDRRTAPRLALLFLGAVLARGRRSVTSWIRAACLSDQFRPCYTTVASAGTKAETIAARGPCEQVGCAIQIRPLQHFSSAIAAPNRSPRRTSMLIAFGTARMDGLSLVLCGPASPLSFLLRASVRRHRSAQGDRSTLRSIRPKRAVLRAAHSTRDRIPSAVRREVAHSKRWPSDQGENSAVKACQSSQPV
jgi:hypothetical protein